MSARLAGSEEARELAAYREKLGASGLVGVAWEQPILFSRHEVVRHGYGAIVLTGTEYFERLRAKKELQLQNWKNLARHALNNAVHIPDFEPADSLDIHDLTAVDKVSTDDSELGALRGAVRNFFELGKDAAA